VATELRSCTARRLADAVEASASRAHGSTERSTLLRELVRRADAWDEHDTAAEVCTHLLDSARGTLAVASSARTHDDRRRLLHEVRAEIGLALALDELVERGLL
jgi:hypothetical protein